MIKAASTTVTLQHQEDGTHILVLRCLAGCRRGYPDLPVPLLLRVSPRQSLQRAGHWF